jgi:hypothetical protein
MKLIVSDDKALPEVALSVAHLSFWEEFDESVEVTVHRLFWSA